MSNYFVSLIFYDLSEIDKISYYSKFRRLLLKEGYYLIQKSVYGKKYKTKDQCRKFYRIIEDFEFSSSKIQAIILTRDQFNNMHLLHGIETTAELILKEKDYIIEF